MSVDRIVNKAHVLSRSMEMIQFEEVKAMMRGDHGAVLRFQEAYNRTSSSFQLSVQAIKDLHREDQSLTELLRDA